MVVETEAYLPENDPACHSFKGRTKRNASMYLEAGHAYVYTMHRQYLFNIVTEGPDRPGAVLVRALEPVKGIELMQRNRGVQKHTELLSGPGKLCAALSISKKCDGMDLTDNTGLLFLVKGLKKLEIEATSRIGISKAVDLNLRFFMRGNVHVSKRRKSS